MLFFRHAEAALLRQRGAAYARLYVALATEDAASVSRESRAVQDADNALAALSGRRRELLDAVGALSSAADGPRSIFDIALDDD